MRVLIVSDTHRRVSILESVMEEEYPFYMLVHCGDIEGDEEEILSLAGENCPCYMVAGNNDIFSDLPRECFFNLAGRNVWVTHGHNYYVSMDTAIIKDEAISRGANIVMFGHTHRPLVQCEDGIYLINPGSMTYPRQAGRQASYIIMNIEEGHEPEFEVVYL